MAWLKFNIIVKWMFTTILRNNWLLADPHGWLDTLQAWLFNTRVRLNNLTLLLCEFAVLSFPTVQQQASPE